MLTDRNSASPISWLVIRDGRNRSTASSLAVSGATAGGGGLPQRCGRVPNRPVMRAAKPAAGLAGEMSTVSAEWACGPASRKTR